MFSPTVLPTVFGDDERAWLQSKPGHDIVYLVDEGKERSHSAPSKRRIVKPMYPPHERATDRSATRPDGATHTSDPALS